jgi:hypothetical protein
VPIALGRDAADRTPSVPIRLSVSKVWTRSATPVSPSPVGRLFRQASCALQSGGLGRWIPTRSATPSTALVPQKSGFRFRTSARFPRDKDGSARRLSSPFSDAGVALRARTQGLKHADRPVRFLTRRSLEQGGPDSSTPNLACSASDCHAAAPVLRTSNTLICQGAWSM